MNRELAIFGGDPVLVEPLKEKNNYDSNEINEGLKILKSGKLSGFVASNTDEFFGGPAVKSIEKRFNDYFDTKYSIAVNSASSGLFAAVYSLGICPGDEVLVTPYTMSASVGAILACSGVPVFVDIHPETLCIDPSKMETLINQKTKAIMVVHLMGNPADMDGIMKIAKKYSINVIEDCAQSPGAMYNRKYTGTFGDIGIFSLNRHKTIQTGEGGIIVTNNQEIAYKLQLIRNHAESVIDQTDDYSGPNLIGWNYRMTELEAAVGSVQIGRLNKLNALRVNNANYLMNRLDEMNWIQPTVPTNKKYKPVFYKFPFRYIKTKIGLKRSTFAQIMKYEGFPLQLGYVKPIYLMKLFQNKDNKLPYIHQLKQLSENYKKGICPIAEKYYFKEFVWSNITHLAHNENELDLFVSALKKIEKAVDTYGINYIEDKI